MFELNFDEFDPVVHAINKKCNGTNLFNRVINVFIGSEIAIVKKLVLDFFNRVISVFYSIRVGKKTCLASHELSDIIR